MRNVLFGLLWPVLLLTTLSCGGGDSVKQTNDGPTDSQVSMDTDTSGDTNPQSDSIVIADHTAQDTDLFIPSKPNPGEFGAPCTSNEDCISGYCIEGLDGYICTKLCTEECPTGYDCVGLNSGPDLVFICVPIIDRSCEACNSDFHCASGRCVSFGTASYCLSPCETNDDCNANYSCQNKTLESEEVVPLCVPTSGTCECVPESLGLEKACKKSTGTAVCYGVQFCEAEGWGGCQLPTEVCDGKDNDCNGWVDDPWLNPASGRYESDEHCGACNNSCVNMAASHAFGKCNETAPVPNCVWSCDDGFFDVNNNPTDGCECEFLATSDDPDVPGDDNCDGIDGVVTDGVFVAKSGLDGALGTMEDPLGTIQAGIEKAFSTGKSNVYVATGVYSESIELQPGVNVYGGYNAQFDSRDTKANQTALMGLPFTDALPGTVNAFSIRQANTVFSGFWIFAADAVVIGDSSYGVYLRDCDAHLKFRNNWVVAGNGRDGEAGVDGIDGIDGISGVQGLDAYDTMEETCSSSLWNIGGGGGARVCGSTDVSGGQGGTAICPDNDESGAQPRSIPYDQTQLANEWGQVGDGPIGGDGGQPGYDSLIHEGSSSNCGICNVPKTPDASQFLPTLGQDGHDGASGTDGANGPGCHDSAGTVIGNFWVGYQGTNGTSGGPGSGGGGGGAGAGVETLNCSDHTAILFTDIGGSGGGAGSGACGGTEGSAGKPGGGSFAIFVVATTTLESLPEVKGNTVQTGSGGDGGDGGNGGVGGDGGSGRPGGASGEADPSAWCADAGGHGGDGGRGGHGGGAGAGCGGPSFAVYLSGAAPALAGDYLFDNEYVLAGDGGYGGQGGKSLGNDGESGLDGATGKANF